MEEELEELLDEVVVVVPLELVVFVELEELKEHFQQNCMLFPALVPLH